MHRSSTVRDRAAATRSPLCHALLTLMVAPAAGLNVGSMALTVSPPADSQRLAEILVPRASLRGCALTAREPGTAGALPLETRVNLVFRGRHLHVDRPGSMAPVRGGNAKSRATSS
jgi:hypothetical protein